MYNRIVGIKVLQTGVYPLFLNSSNFQTRLLSSLLTLGFVDFSAVSSFCFQFSQLKLRQSISLGFFSLKRPLDIHRSNLFPFKISYQIQC